MCSKAFPLRRLGPLALTAVLLLGACGKKGDPLPPLRAIPLQTKDLSVSQQGPRLLLEMTYPSATVSGLALGGIDSVEIFQLVSPVDAEGEIPEVDARSFEPQAESLLVLRGTDLNSAVTGDRIQIRLALPETMPEEPSAIFFGAQTSKGEEISDLSNLASLIPIEPPAPPTDLQTTAKVNGVEIRWSDGSDASEGYDVFRRQAQERGYGKPIKRLEGSERSYLDQGARYGDRYIYTVRSVAGTDPLIYSAEAGEVEIDYQDRFPPPLPKNFVALPEDGSVRLRWEPSRAPDLAGYFIYRRNPGRNDFLRLNQEPVTGFEFLDRGLANGLTFAYQIQAVDRSGNESETSKVVSVTLR